MTFLRAPALFAFVFGDFMKRQNLIRAGLAALVGLACLTSVQAQSYPTKPVRLIVPFPAGGPTDLVGREAANILRDELKVRIVYVSHSIGEVTRLADDVALMNDEETLAFLRRQAEGARRGESDRADDRRQRHAPLRRVETLREADHERVE